MPQRVAQCVARWQLVLESPYDDGSCSWTTRCRFDGREAVLKLGWPHFEAHEEIAGLRHWRDAGVVHVLAADPSTHALVLERCTPGTPLRTAPFAVQDATVAAALKRLWSTPAPMSGFRDLATMWAAWTDDLTAPDPLVRTGLECAASLLETTVDPVLLATDLHAGNVLAAEREPWLVIDPKPFLGDPAYDATQHLLNSPERLLADGHRVIRSFSAQLQVDPERVHGWLLARTATEWDDPTLARHLLAIGP